MKFDPGLEGPSAHAWAIWVPYSSFPLGILASIFFEISVGVEESSEKKTVAMNDGVVHPV